VKRNQLWSALALGMICATLGFSYSLATVPSASTPGGDAIDRELRAGAREGRLLRFSDPFILAGSDANFPAGGDVAADPDGFELGDVANTVSFERGISTLGGVRPTKITSVNLANSAGGGIFLDENGILFGKASLAGSFAFNATVKDARGSERTGYFRMNSLTPAAGDFRFAMNRVANAQVGQDYVTKVEAISPEGGFPFYSVVPGSVILNGVARTDLEFNGFTLFDDGTLAGRPIIAGTMTFTARATKAGIKARNRAGTAEDQTFTMTIEAESAMQSQIATTQMTLKGDYSNPTRGQISYKAQLQTGDRALGDFSGSLFIFRIAGTTFSTTLDSFGQQRFGDVRVKLSATKGEIQVTVRNVDTAILFPQGTIASRGGKTVTVQIDLGSKFRYVEALETSATSNRNRFQLSYRLGKQTVLGGLYQITRIQAAEFFEGTAYRVYFIQSGILSNPASQTGDGSVKVFLGGTFSQTVPLFRGKAKIPPDGVRSVLIANKTRRGKLETYPLTQTETGIPKPSNSNGAAQTFYMGLDINTPTIFLSGDSVQTIFPFFGRRR